MITSTFAAGPGQATAGLAGVTLRYGIKIPLRDGVCLTANVFLPAESVSPQPVVFVLTPYTTDRYYIDDCIYYAKNGYACAVADVRGRGDSQGQFVPFENDGRDGYDVVEWLVVARRVSRGSRLRLTLTPPLPDFERNYNSGKAVEHETANDARLAHVRLYHDGRHPSALEVPLMSAAVN